MAERNKDGDQAEMGGGIERWEDRGRELDERVRELGRLDRQGGMGKKATGRMGVACLLTF